MGNQLLLDGRAGSHRVKGQGVPASLQTWWGEKAVPRRQAHRFDDPPYLDGTANDLEADPVAV